MCLREMMSRSGDGSSPPHPPHPGVSGATVVPAAVLGGLGGALLALGLSPSQNLMCWNILGLYDLCRWVMLES